MGVGVEVENWVEPSRPRNDKEKLHDFIVQEGLLQLQPPVGKLGPGESTTWTITYRQACAANPEALQVAFVTRHVMLLPGTNAGLRQSLAAECFYNISCCTSLQLLVAQHSIGGPSTSQCFMAAVEPSWFTGGMQRTTTSP